MSNSEVSDQTPPQTLHDKDSYVIRPISMYPFLQLLQSPLAFTFLFTLSFSIALFAWISNDSITLAFADFLREKKFIIYISFILSTLGLIILWVYHYIEYTQIRYVFSNFGISLERGINFHGDFVSWKQINDVNIKRNLFQRMIGSGTIELECTDYSTKSLHEIGHSKELYYYLKRKIGKQLANARRIVRG